MSLNYSDQYCGTSCQRCNDPKPPTISMSRFNTQMICEACDTKERNHPKYQEAADTELAEVLKGNYNYEGIGLPEDLRQ